MIENESETNNNFRKEISEWELMSFDAKTNEVLTIDKKQQLLDFFELCGAQEYKGYEYFITDNVNDGDADKINNDTETIDDLKSIYAPNGFELKKWTGEVIDYAAKGINLEADAFSFRQGAFTHVRFFGNNEITDDRESNIFCRFYLCPETQNVTSIVSKLVDKYKESDQKLIMKFTTDKTRNDRLVVYSGRQDAPVQLELLYQLKNENPDLFKNLGKNKLWGEIEGIEGIYFGQENPNSGFSFSEDRARVVENAFSLIGAVSKNAQIDSSIKSAFFDLCSIARRVNPKYWSKYLGDEFKTEISDADDIAEFIRETARHPEEDFSEYIEEIDIDLFIKKFEDLDFCDLSSLKRFLKQNNDATFK